MTAPSSISPDAAWRELHRVASEPYRQAGRFAWHFARGKLKRDPFFRAMIERGLVPAQARVLDLGAGQGLLASLLGACERLAGSGQWPASWADAPAPASYTGIELMPRDIERAQAALDAAPNLQFVCADMCQAEFPDADVVVILDVLHHVDHAAQVRVLTRVRDALAPRGRLLLRIGDMAQVRGYAVSQWVDRVVSRIRGHRTAPTFGRSVTGWRSALEDLGFRVDAQAMSQGTPFANTLLVGDLAPGAA